MTRIYMRLGLFAALAGIGFLVFEFARKPDYVAPDEAGRSDPASNDAASASANRGPEEPSRVTPERNSPAMEPTEGARPVSVSQPVLSFPGFLEAHVQSLPWDTAEAVQVGSSQSPAHMLQSRYFNPEGKSLSDEQEKQLSALVKDYDAKRAKQLRREGALSKAAFVRAIQSGLFQVVEFGPAPSWSDPDAMRAYTKDQQVKSKQLLADMTAKLGEPLVDWAYTSIASSEPDGIPRQTIVYFMHRDAPEVFAVRKGMDDFQGDHDQALRDFFRRL